MHRYGWLLGLWLVATVGLLAQALSLTPSQWKTYATNKLTKRVSDDGGLELVFPTYPQTLHYAWTVPTAPLTGTLVVSLRVDVIGAPVFVWDPDGNPCETPATVRPFFGRWSQKGQRSIGFSDRWWALNPYSYTLGPGGATIAVPMDRTFFTGWWANKTLSADAAFALAASDPDLVGLSFGGGCFFGHGIGVSGGAASLVVTSYAIE